MLPRMRSRKGEQMKSHNHRLMPYLLGLVLFITAVGQAFSQQATTRAGTTDNGGSVMSPEEKVIRLAYRKLTAFNKAARLYEAKDDDQPLDNKLVLAFELRNFHVGPIQEILGSRHKDLVTLPTGEIINLGHGVSQFNKGEEQVYYTAHWSGGQYSSG